MSGAPATARPRAITPQEAGAGCQGGWLAPDGRFYAAQRQHHIRVAAELRATGDGPSEPWDIRDGWVVVRPWGEVLALPDRLTQPQWDALGDMLAAAPAGSFFRSALLAALRQLREMELGG